MIGWLTIFEYPFLFTLFRDCGKYTYQEMSGISRNNLYDSCEWVLQGYLFVCCWDSLNIPFFNTLFRDYGKYTIWFLQMGPTGLFVCYWFIMNENTLYDSCEWVLQYNYLFVVVILWIFPFLIHCSEIRENILTKIPCMILVVGSYSIIVCLWLTISEYSLF